jgi:hypothetical protein
MFSIQCHDVDSADAAANSSSTADIARHFGMMAEMYHKWPVVRSLYSGTWESITRTRATSERLPRRRWLRSSLLLDLGPGVF